MSRQTRHSAYHRLVDKGPWVDGSAHGYHPKGTDQCYKHVNEEWRHEDGGKYGQGYKHCLFCAEDFPFHREYCPWFDFFIAWNDKNPMEVDYSMDKGKVPLGCKAGVHGIDEI